MDRGRGQGTGGAIIARIESQAVAGFYATPGSQVARIAALLSIEEYEAEVLAEMHVALLDPCAGEGAAIEELARVLSRPIALAAEAKDRARRATRRRESRERSEAKGLPIDDYDRDPVEPPIEETVFQDLIHAQVYAAELEEKRCEALKQRSTFSYGAKARLLHGDAFCATFDAGEGGVGFLFLNPPYDTDKVFRRFEERFLRRFTEALAPGGVLAFVVPHYALSASAETLARRYEDVACYRFAGEEHDTYKQVVVFARRLERDRDEADPEILELVNLWASKGPECPELPEAGKPHRRPRYVVPLRSHSGEALGDWKVKVVDATALLAKYTPWSESTRRGEIVPLARVVPDFALVDVMHRTYEVATPPRPAHIAAGLAAGLFNGQRIEADDEATKLPPLLVKGCFDREWKTIEEKHNKEGDKTGEVQVQAPKLVVTILDLKNHAYHTLRQETTASAKAPASAADLTVGDLLAHYGRSLMGVMERQCVILYDPRRDAGKYEICETKRELFTAQAHAVRGILTVLRERGERRSPVLLGEIGVGKSITALVAARSHGAKRVLIFCPPHLLDSWRNEVAAVFPDADYRVLSSVVDVDRIAEARSDFLVAVVSREAAKLGHRLEGVAGVCPRCGGHLRDDAEDLAKRRGRCERRIVHPENDLACFASELAIQLRSYGSDRYLPGRLRPRTFAARQVAVGAKPSEEPPAYAGLPPSLIGAVRERLIRLYLEGVGHESPVWKALAWALVAEGASPELLLSVARRLKPDHYDYRHYAESLLLLLPEGGALGAAFQLLGGFPKPALYAGGGQSASEWFRERYAKVAAGDTPEVRDDEYDSRGIRFGDLLVQRGDDGLTVGEYPVGSVGAAGELLRLVGSMGEWSEGPLCGEHLYQSTPEPRRYPLAKYVVKRHRETFDFVIIDECHEAGNADAAQSVAAHRLTALNLPSILMTGTVMNGYAESLFANFWATDKDFREEFERREVAAFVDRYGYRKRYVSDKEDGKVVAYGSQSDRVERSEKDVGSAPGVLPLFLFNHLLKGAVTLHKADLRIDLPALSQERAVATAEGELKSEFDRMVKDLVDQIKEDRFKGPDDGDLAGKLFGQLSEIPSYLDRATIDVGNGGKRTYEVRYPESVGGALVTEGKLFPKDILLPKEEILLDTVEAEVRADRRAMVFGWHLELLPRLARLLQERLGEPVPVLYADKVPTAKRQGWIDKNIVAKKVRVMVVNPVCIQTGLNNLTWFQTIFQYENPACNPIVDRQSIGRIDRIGQKFATRVFRAYYGSTLQEKMYDLLMSKVAISTATDGLDPESAMLAAGIEPSSFVTGLSLGKALYAMMEEGMFDERPKLRVVSGGRK